MEGEEKSGKVVPCVSESCGTLLEYDNQIFFVRAVRPRAVPFRREKLVHSFCSFWVDPPLHTAHAYSSLGWTAPIKSFFEFRTVGENFHLRRQIMPTRWAHDV